MKVCLRPERSKPRLVHCSGALGASIQVRRFLMRADRHCGRGRTSRRLTWIAVLGFALFATEIVNADSAVILGAGQIGNWSTSGSVANPNASQTDLLVAPSPVIATLVPCSPPAPCPYANVSLHALGSASLPFSFAGFDFGTVYVTQQSQGQALPVVQASLTDQDFCQSAQTLGATFRRSVDIPVVTLSKLIAADLSTLNFPRVAAFPEVIVKTLVSNVVLGNIQRADGIPGEDLPLLLELFDSQGNLVGSTSLTLAYGETRVFGNVTSLGRLLFGGGQLRVTRVSGHALMWGILYTVDSDFGVTASTGVNLSP